jgi:hypothetical protein
MSRARIGKFPQLSACGISRLPSFVTTLKIKMKAWVPRFILAIIAASVLAGCASPVAIKTYDGQQLSAEDVAFLMVDRQIFVSDVAGYRTGITLGTKPESMEGTQFELKPGLHKIRFEFFSQSSSSDNVGVPRTATTVTTTYSSVFTLKPVDITFNVEKGRRYELHYRRDGKTVTARIVDVTEGGAKRGYGVAWGYTGT